MNEADEIEEKSQEYIKYFEKNKDKIPNIEKLIKILKKDKKAGHIFHAECVKRFFEGGKFEVTNIEINYKVNGMTKDVDIELNHNINLQIWHGASVSVHRELKRGKVSGGIKPYWGEDKDVIDKKLKQLPDDKFGLLICWEHHLGISVLPDWLEKIPSNKSIAKLYQNGIQNDSILYHSNNFKYLDLAKEVISALGFTIIATNI